ncbi:MAG: DNA gyrase subunit A [Fusobacteriaceae bacterium]
MKIKKVVSKGKKKHKVTSSVEHVSIINLMKSDFLAYTIANMVRSIPDYRDGLKPSQRRALFTMYKLGLGLKKSARVVGEMIGKYHPHGDQAAYGTIVRMGQSFKNNMPLATSQGNFGSIDGDSEASMRYTEVSLSNFAKDVFFNDEFIAVEMQKNYDETLLEPVVFCPKIPVVLVNGTSGIATGVATDIPPHNVSEIIAATTLYLNYKIRGKIMNPVLIHEELKGPDFPTGGVLYDTSGDGIKRGIDNGSSQLWLLPKIKTEEKLDYGRTAIVLEDMAYSISKDDMMMKIANLVKCGKLEGISDLRDESDGRHGVRVVIVLKKNIHPKQMIDYLVINKVIATTIKYSMTFVKKNKPVKMGVYDIIENHVLHRKDVLLKFFNIVIDKTRLDIHLQEGVLIFIKNFKEASTVILNGKSEEDVVIKLMKKFKLTKSQSEYILDTKMRNNIKNGDVVKTKITELSKKLVVYSKHVDNPYKYMYTELLELHSMYKSKRNTKIIKEKSIRLIKETKKK